MKRAEALKQLAALPAEVREAIAIVVEKPIPKIDDRTMAAIKGFDKWSFRRETR